MCVRWVLKAVLMKLTGLHGTNSKKKKKKVGIVSSSIKYSRIGLIGLKFMATYKMDAGGVSGGPIPSPRH